VSQNVRDFIENIRDRASIEEVVGKVVRLSSGSRPIGLCPFHSEDGPSFTVYPEQGRFRCFGCGVGGSVFDFVMLQEGVDFWEAAVRLGDRYGIPLPEYSAKDQAVVAKESEVREILGRFVVASHQKLLKCPEALEYLHSRGITDESIREYQLGLGVGISSKAKHPDVRSKAVEAGLISVKDGREFELMKGRLICPIIRNGRVVQITGRLMPDAEGERGKRKSPKYLGLADKGFTPKQPLNSHRLREKHVALVEGYIDCILLEQEGIAASATTGTVFKDEWLRYCGKDTRFSLCYDTDANQAGQQANEKIGQVFFDAGRAVEVLELPMGHDPASYVLANGGDAFRSELAQAKQYISYWIHRQPASSTAHDVERILQSAYGMLARLDKGIRGRYVAELAAYFKLTRGDVRDGLSDYLKRPANIEHSTSNVERGESAGGDGHQVGEVADDDGRPVVYADNEDLDVTTLQVVEAVKSKNSECPIYFRQGGVPIRLRLDDNGATTAQRWTLDIARHELVQIISWRRTVHKKGGGSFDVVATPKDVQIRNFLSTKDMPLPILSRITDVPVFAPDGSLQTEPGYHAASRTYYVPAAGLEIPPVPDSPTPMDMKKAIDTFDDVVCDFPFVAAADKAHAFCLWLLAFVRDMIPGSTPMHLIEAPSPGSGKGLLMDALVLPSVGSHVGSVTQATDEDEWRKRLTSVIIKGQQVVMIDNVTRMLDSGTLASALTQLVWEDRILGRSESVDVPVRCIWVCTANNPAMSTEIARRCIRVRIDPKRDQPWNRSGFRHVDLRTYVLSCRAEMIWAALTIVRGWIAAGMKPYSGKVLGSFEQWTRVLGGICEHVGIEGFLGNLLELYEQADVEGQQWRAFVEQWWEAFRDRQIGVSELFEIAEKSDLFNFGKVSDHSKKISFGRKLGAQRDRVIGDFQVLQSPQKKARAVQWMLKRVSGDDAEDSKAGSMMTEELPMYEDDIPQEYQEYEEGEIE